MNAIEDYNDALRLIAIDILEEPIPAIESIQGVVRGIWKWISEKIASLISAIKTLYYRVFKKREMGSFVHKKLLPLFDRCDHDSYGELKKEEVGGLNLQSPPHTLSTAVKVLEGETKRWTTCVVAMKRILMTQKEASEYVDSKKFEVTSKAMTYTSNALFPAFKQSAEKAASTDADSAQTAELKRLVASCAALLNQMGRASAMLFYKNQDDALSAKMGNVTAASM